MTPSNTPRAVFSNIEDQVVEFIASAQASSVPILNSALPLPGMSVKQGTLKRYAASGLQLTEEIRRMLRVQHGEGATPADTAS